MTHAIGSSYDEVPYTSYPYSRTHPDRLCMLARLFGLPAADPRESRVLELGCAAGGNLIPMAEHLPNSTFVGVDRSARQIAEGHEFLAAVGLGNVELRCASITDVDASFGTFDYVICHGVYSWVPAPVQAKILEICRDRLAPGGVGYVSYNTYPGWHLRDSVRRMMRWHVRGFAEPRRRIDQARALVDFLVRSAAHQSGPYALLLERELAILARTGDDYVFHEHLEDENEPLYFYEFVERLERYRLQFLCESEVHTMFARELPPDVGETLDRLLPDLLHMEQYLDFVRNRQFRASLVCHADAELHRALGPGVIKPLRTGFAGRPHEGTVDLTPGVEHRFTGLEGNDVVSREPLTKAAFVRLMNLWPADVAFAELVEHAVAQVLACGLAVPSDPDASTRLASDVLECMVCGGGVDLRVHPPDLAFEPTTFPRTAATARWQSRRYRFATNGRHQRVDLDALAVEVVNLADGSRDHAAILDALVDWSGQGTVPDVFEDGRTVDPAARREVLTSRLDRALEGLLRHGLLCDAGETPGQGDEARAQRKPVLSSRPIES